MRSALLLAALVLSLGIAAGCAGDEPETSPANEWADIFCSATVAWTDELRRIAGTLTDLTTISSAKIETASEEAREATDEYLDEVRGLGAPDTESGEEIKTSLDRLADEVDGEMDEIEDAVDDIQGLTGLVTAGREVSASVAAMFVSLQRVFETIESSDPSGELKTAFEESDACDEISSR